VRIGVGVQGFPPPASAQQRSSGILYLARTNFITTTSLGVTNGILVNWNAGSGGTVGLNNKPSIIYLGQTNAFHTDNVTVGSVKASYGGLLAFNSSGLNNPVAFFRGVSGDSSRVSLWAIGSEASLNGSNQSANG